MLVLKNDQWSHLCLACEISSYFILFKFSKLSFGSVGTSTYAPYLEHAIKDQNMSFQTIFYINMDSLCAKLIDYAVKTRIKHKRWWKRIILNEEFTEN